MKAYKLVKQRKDGTLGPLFINTRQRIKIGTWLPAEAHRKKGFAFRPGWHCTAKPSAPHIHNKPDRVWWEVEIDDFTEFPRPRNQGGMWYLAQKIKFIKQLET
jgi:hypothetical protein